MGGKIVKSLVKELFPEVYREIQLEGYSEITTAEEDVIHNIETRIEGENDLLSQWDVGGN